MGKQDLYTYSRVLFSLKKDEDSDTCYNRDGPGEHYAKWNKPLTRRYFMIPLLWGT